MMARVNLRRLARCIASIVVVLAALPTAAAQAGTGLNTFYWQNSQVTLSSSSYRYSNMTGFWQTIVNANACPISVDGNYGDSTTWYTAVFQNSILGSNNGGVMTPSVLNSVQNASSVYGYRLSIAGPPDGFGTRPYHYYAGFDSPNVLGWNPISSQWLFAQYPASNPAALVPATPNRTIGSAPACA